MKNGYVENTLELISLLSKNPGVLEKYAETMKSRIYMAAKDISLCTDANMSLLLRGQLSICFEQYNAATTALNDPEGKANPDKSKEIPEWPL